MKLYFSKKKSDDIRIYFSDDQKIKSFGELLTSDSGREILKILLAESMTANQISQKTGISLQLVKYHINKMHYLGIVNVSKVEKNSKSHDMKYYVAEKFAIMILPQTELDKLKQKVIDTIHDTSKVTVLAISAASAWMMTQIIQPSSQNPIVDSIRTTFSYSGIKDLPNTADEALHLARAKVEIAHSGIGSGTPLYTPESLIIQVIIFGGVMAGLAGVFFWKAKTHQARIHR